ncbi:FAD-binding oxidoreductase [bacterium]|nr:FAD-binding oxidoreductase [bacterium]
MNLAPLRESVRGELRDDDSILATYNRDASRLKARPLGVFWPLDTTDVHSVVHWARERSIPLVPRGAGTGLAGGSVGQGLIVDTARLTQIEIQEDNLLAIVGAGVINTHLQDALKPYRLFWPPDPSSHRISSSEET